MKHIITVFLLTLLFITTTSAQSDRIKQLIHEGYGTVMAMTYQSGIDNMNRGNYREAIKDFTSYLQTERTESLAYFNRGVCKAKLGSYQSALSDFNLAIKYNSSLGQAYLNRGIIKIKLGNSTGACSDFNKASSLGVYCDDLIARYCR